MVNLVTVNGSFSGSESFFNNPFEEETVKAISSFVEFVSTKATGESFTGETVISKVEVDVFVPSVAV